LQYHVIAVYYQDLQEDRIFTVEVILNLL